VGVLFIVAERARPGEDAPEDLSLRRALFVGFAQAVALVPGTSRSGITIVAGMAAGLCREGAIRFSFLLSIPIILGATLTKMPAVLAEGLSAREHSVLAVAFVFALVSGVLAIRFLLRFAAGHTLVPFAWYRFALAAAVLVYYAAVSG
jgi:undecaprenyl-diphosphatase